jgi:hypothetical protein
LLALELKNAYAILDSYSILEAVRWDGARGWRRSSHVASRFRSGRVD